MRLKALIRVLVACRLVSLLSPNFWRSLHENKADNYPLQGNRNFAWIKISLKGIRKNFWHAQQPQYDQPYQPRATVYQFLPISVITVRHGERFNESSTQTLGHLKHVVHIFRPLWSYKNPKWLIPCSLVFCHWPLILWSATSPNSLYLYGRLGKLS